MSLDAATLAQVEAFADQLDAQAACYRAVLALGAEQAAALEAHDLAAFHELLGQKATLLGDIAGLDATAAPYRVTWEAHRSDVEEPLRVRLRAIVDEIRGLLEQLLDMERACETQLAATKQDVERELSQLGQGRQALRSYQPQAEPPAQRLDLGG